jgi:hypothetical protein
MRLDISAGGLDVVVSRAPHSRTITTIATRQIGTPVPGAGK